MTLSLINMLANWRERRGGSFCKIAAYPVLGPDPRNWGKETPYYILVRVFVSQTVTGKFCNKLLIVDI